MRQMVGQSDIGRTTIVLLQQPIQFRLQTSGDRPQPMPGDFGCRVAISQGQSSLQQTLHRQGEAGGRRRQDLDQALTTANQVVQTALMEGLLAAKLVVGHPAVVRSEEHTSELQSRLHLVCRLLLEKKKKNVY